MKRSDKFEEAALTLKPHPLHAQILLEIRASDTTLERAKTILKGAGVGAVQCKFLQKGEVSWVLLAFLSGDMREAVYLLTEAGFTRLKGINPVTKPSCVRDGQISV